MKSNVILLLVLFLIWYIWDFLRLKMTLNWSKLIKALSSKSAIDKNQQFLLFLDVLYVLSALYQRKATGQPFRFAAQELTACCFTKGPFWPWNTTFHHAVIKRMLVKNLGNRYPFPFQSFWNKNTNETNLFMHEYHSLFYNPKTLWCLNIWQNYIINLW